MKGVFWVYEWECVEEARIRLRGSGEGESRAMATVCEGIYELKVNYIYFF